MGQQESLLTNNQLNSIRTNKYNYQTTFIQHQGILKLRSIPFHNSIQISKSPVLYLQNSEITLANLLKERINTTRLFTEQDILKLIQSVLYALAYLQTKKIVYKDLIPQNIYYDSQSITFKLLPPQLLKQSSYQQVLNQSRFSPISPEMVIGIRCGQTEIQADIYNKSNVFSLGMILLQVVSLKECSDCYEENSYDILDHKINERLQIARQFYSEKIFKFLSLMLHYDYSERMTLKEISIFVNREANQIKNIRLNKSRNQKQIIKINSPIKYNHFPQQQSFHLNESQIQNAQVLKLSPNKYRQHSPVSYHKKSNVVPTYQDKIHNISRSNKKRVTQPNIFQNHVYPQSKHSNINNLTLNDRKKVGNSRINTQQSYQYQNFQNYPTQMKNTPYTLANFNNNKNQTFSGSPHYRERMKVLPFQQNKDINYKQNKKQIIKIEKNAYRKSLIYNEIDHSKIHNINKNENRHTISQIYEESPIKKQNLKYNYTQEAKENKYAQKIDEQMQDQSISRIKQEIQKSRKLIEQFQKSNPNQENSNLKQYKI